MDGMGTKDKKMSGVVSISRGETHQPTHNNQKIRQASGRTTRHKASGQGITRWEGRGGQCKTSDWWPRPVSANPTHNNQIEKWVGGGQHDERGGWTREARGEGADNGKAIGRQTTCMVPQNLTSNRAKNPSENRVFRGGFCTIWGTIWGTTNRTSNHTRFFCDRTGVSTYCRGAVMAT